MGFKRKAAEWKAKIEKCVNDQFEWVKEGLVSSSSVLNLILF